MLAAVHEMMAVRPAGWESSRHARCKYLLPGIGDKDKLAFKYVDKLVLLGVPVSEGRGASGWEASEIYTEVRQPQCVSQPASLTRLCLASKHARIIRTPHRGHGFGIDGRYLQ